MKGLKLLFIEENTRIREKLTKAFEGFGMTVCSKKSAMKGISVAGFEHFDFVLIGTDTGNSTILDDFFTKLRIPHAFFKGFKAPDKPLSCPTTPILYEHAQTTEIVREVADLMTGVPA